MVINRVVARSVFCRVIGICDEAIAAGTPNPLGKQDGKPEPRERF